MRNERPFALERLLVALDLAVDLRTPDRDQQVADSLAGTELAQGAVAAVDEALSESSRFAGCRGWRRRRGHARRKRSPSRLARRVELAVGEPGVVVDKRVHELVADPHPLLSTRHVPVAGESVPRPAKAGGALGIDMEQITGDRATRIAAPLRAPSKLGRSPPAEASARRSRARGRSRQRSAADPSPSDAWRHRSALARWPPTAGAVMRPRGTILETNKRSALFTRSTRPAAPPLAGSRWRNTTTSCRRPARATRLDIPDQAATTGESEPSVTVKPHPGPPSVVSLRRPTASKEARKTYSAVHDLFRHVI